MNRYPRASSLLMAAAMVLAGLVLAGCSDDDPVTPTPGPEPGYLAVTPDSLMSLWSRALTTMDSTLYGDVLHPDFQFRFRMLDVDIFQLLTDHMTRDETVRTAWNMFSGQDVTNWQGVTIPGVSRIQLPFMVQETPWQFEAVGSAPATASARFSLQMFVERGFGYPILAATGRFDFVAIAKDTVDASGAAVEYYRLVLMTEAAPPEKSSEVNSWGGVHLTYLQNEAPEAALLVSDIGGTPLPLYSCDASGSRDPDSGLHPEGFRWQFDPSGAWTEWGADPVTTHGYDRTGPKTITVQVRDRWGARATAARDVDVVGPELPFPSTPDQLMANLIAVYETRYLDGYAQMLHPDFLTVLQEATTSEFPDVGPTLDVEEELHIHERMFSGEALTDPDGNLVPGLTAVAFQRFQALDSWALSPPDDLIPNAPWAPFEVDILFDRGQNYSYLRVEGVIKFYVTRRDSLYRGQVRPYFQMAGQVDLTGLVKGVETARWGSVKALWR